MERYKLMKELGDGTCGCVYKALDIETKEIVAIKKMRRKFYSWEECMNLCEVKSLCKLNHPNIVKLKEVVRENHELFFIFEHMEYNLYQVIKDRQTPLPEADIRSLMSQVLQGLAHMHNNGYFHRDLKPENLLVTNDTIKIADFGLAREVSSTPPYTDYVSTRWYRAPEVLLQSSSYTPAIDMWAVGAILAELFTLLPIFPGESETDQLSKICHVLGTPVWASLPEEMNLSRFANCSFPEILPINLSHAIPNASMEAIDLIRKLCSWDPRKRPTAEQALHHPFFNVGTWVPNPPLDLFEAQDNHNKGAKPKLDLSLWDFSTKSDDCFLGLTLAVKPSVPNLDVVHPLSQNRMEEMMFYSGFPSQPDQSVWWSLLSSNQNGNGVPLMSSLPSSYFMNSQVPCPATGVPQAQGGSAYSSPQSNFFERPYMTMSTQFQHGNYFGYL